MKMICHSFIGASIVDVDRYTDHSVWIRGRRYKRKTSYESYFATAEEYKEFLGDMSDLERRLERAERNVESLKQRIADRNKLLPEAEEFFNQQHQKHNEEY